MVIDLDKHRRFRELMRQARVLETDLHAKLENLHQVNTELGNLCIELMQEVSREADTNQKAQTAPSS